MIGIKVDLLWGWFLHNRSLLQVGGRAEFTDRESAMRVQHSRRRWWLRQVESVVARVLHPSHTAGQDHQGCHTKNDPRHSVFHDCHPPEHARFRFIRSIRVISEPFGLQAL